MNHLIVPFLAAKNVEAILTILGHLDIHQQVVVSDSITSIPRFTIALLLLKCNLML